MEKIITTQQPHPMPSVGNHSVRFDVMEVLSDGDLRYVCTLTMPHNKLYPPSDEEYAAFVVAHRPSMARRKFRIAF